MPHENFTYFIKIFGCQMNYVDAEIFASTLEERGGVAISEVTEANLIVVVTCGVRAAAEERAVSWIKKAGKKNEKASIVLTGCLARREDIKSRLEDVAEFVPIEDWAAYITAYTGSQNFACLAGRPRTSAVQGRKASLHKYDRSFYQISPRYYTNFRAYLPIMTGCNNFCSYCVVPYARGREKSRPPEEILREAKKLTKEGFKELCLLGQNVNSYRGVDGKGRKWNFAELLESIDKIPGRFWIKFISSHPKDISDDFISVFKKCRKVSPNLHLPVQSGSNKILKAMNRRYAPKDYLGIISRVRKECPKVIFSTDIIVGFPGETGEDFKDSLDIVKKVGFEMLFSLKYSPRPGTASFKLRDDVSAQTKKDRQRKLDKVWKKIAQKKNQRFIGKKITILIDRIKETKDGHGKITCHVQGKSFENKDVVGELKIEKRKDLVGKWAAVRITDVTPLALRGKLVRVEK